MVAKSKKLKKTWQKHQNIQNPNIAQRKKKILQINGAYIIMRDQQPPRRSSIDFSVIKITPKKLTKNQERIRNQTKKSKVRS